MRSPWLQDLASKTAILPLRDPGYQRFPERTQPPGVGIADRSLRNSHIKAATINHPKGSMQIVLPGQAEVLVAM